MRFLPTIATLLPILGWTATVFAGPQLRIGPIEGLTSEWHVAPADVQLPIGVAVELEFTWGRNRADLNADGRVDLLDYAKLSLCFSAPGGRQPSACAAGSYRAADLDADGDVDIDDANAFNQAMLDLHPYVVESVTWFGAHEISRTDSRTRAELDLSEPGDRVVRVEVAMIDPFTQRPTQHTREITIHVVDSPANAVTAAWAQESTPSARGSADPAVQLLVNAFNPDGKDLSALDAGDVVLFEVGVSVDPSYTPPETTGPGGNRGIGTLVYDVNSAEAMSQGFFLNPMQDAFSGFNTAGDPATVASRLYNDSASSTQVNYGGGWGFDRAGLPGGGTVTAAGGIIAAGISAPLAWTADTHFNFPGLQPSARLDVGAGLYTFPPDDPIAGGLQGGFGQDLSNMGGLVPGDGTWMFQTGVIDTTGWNAQTYNFDLILPEGGAALFDGAVDYSIEHFGSFRANVPLGELGNAAFSFTIIDTDCNENGVPDDQDILGGTSDDCNSNSIPDECEPDEDCNANGAQDICDITTGTSQDCNANRVPDECEPDEDCNDNGVQDFCDLSLGTSQDCQQDQLPDECQLTGNDCNSNAIPDECEPVEDCNANNVQDICDLALGTSRDCQEDVIPDECQLTGNDCNSNSIPDECDIAASTSEDCNSNGVPDECEPAEDCNANSVQDICDIAAATSADCNFNAVPDGCDIASGTSDDCNANSIPDECEPVEDCNGNGVQDICDIAAATSVDCNANRVPDECEADCNGNGIPDECDSARGIVGTNSTNQIRGILGRVSGFFLDLSEVTGEATAISGFGLRGFKDVRGLAYDPNTNTLYGSNVNTLITIDPATGAGTVVGDMGFFRVEGLAFDPNSNTLYGVDSGFFGSKQLIVIDPVTGAGTAVGALGFERVFGLAFDTNTDMLYGTDLATGQLIVIDPATGVGTAVGALGFLAVTGLAFDPNTNALYGADLATDQLIVIDSATGAGTPVGPLGFASVRGLAFGPNTSTLYGTDVSTDQLIVIDPATGEGTAVGPLGFRSVVGLAFDLNTNTLYGTDTFTDQLIVIDPATGAGTAVGALGFERVFGLAFDPNTNTLYGADIDTDQLIVIDPATGAGTAAGALGFNAVAGLAFDPNTNALYGTDSSTAQLIVIDPATGAGTAAGALGFASVRGLAFDPNTSTSTLYGTDVITDQLIVIDPATGAGAPVGALGFRSVVGLAFDPITSVLYGTDVFTNQLIAIDPATGAGKAAGILGFFEVRGLAFDPNSNTLYGVDSGFLGTKQLIVIDPATGEGTAVGALGLAGVRGLAFDPNTNTLYGSQRSLLIVIDTATGAAAHVGLLRFSIVEGLAFDPNTNTLFGTDVITDQLIVIDPATGAGTAVGPLGFDRVEGLAFDPVTNRLYGTDIDTDQLIVINPATGAGTPIGPTRYFNIFGLAFIPTLDCNDNDTQDECDISEGTSDDCNANAIPDECEPDEDCNGNGVRDICDIGQGASADCQQDRIPDDCQLAGNDCNSNSVPDECDTDCNGNDTPDQCDVAAGATEDCNSNGIPDECDPDCDVNSIPDECEPAFVNQEAELRASDGAFLGSFGISVGISSATTVVGASRHDDNGTDSGSAYVFEKPPLAGMDMTETAKLVPSDGAQEDGFGQAVAISGDTIVVGTPLDDDNGSASGSAYVFVRSGTAWSQQAKLLPSNGAQGDGFGRSVAISGDTIVVGAAGGNGNGDNSGSAYVFVRSGTVWSQRAKLLPSDGAFLDLFSDSMAISGDTIVVGAHLDDDNGDRSGSAYVFEKPPLGWVDMTETVKLLASDGAAVDGFGFSVAISGETIAVGAPGDDDNGSESGSAYVFEKSSLGWTDMTETGKLLPSDGDQRDFFGISVAISSDWVVVGARGDDDRGHSSGSAYLFVRSATSWIERAKLLPCDGGAADFFGESVAISSNRVVVGAHNHNDNGTISGSAYVFKLPPRVLPLDIKPGVCPNSFNLYSHGVLSVALLGSAGFDVSRIDLSSVRLTRADQIGGSVAPYEGPPGPHSVLADTATPFNGENCNCHDLAADGFTDLSMKFRTDDLVAALELDTLPPGALVEMVVSGTLLDGSEFVASDCVRLARR